MAGWRDGRFGAHGGSGGSGGMEEWRNGGKERWREGGMDGRMEGGTEEWREGAKEGWRYERTDAFYGGESRATLPPAPPHPPLLHPSPLHASPGSIPLPPSSPCAAPPAHSFYTAPPRSHGLGRVLSPSSRFYSGQRHPGPSDLGARLAFCFTPSPHNAGYTAPVLRTRACPLSLLPLLIWTTPSRSLGLGGASRFLFHTFTSQRHPGPTDWARPR